MSDTERSSAHRDDLTPHLDRTYESLSGVAISGDREARIELIDTCRDYLLFIANQELDARIHAKCAPSDVVQNVLVKAVEHFDEFQGENQRALLGWLRRILVNEIVDTRRAFLGSEKRDVRRENPGEHDPNSVAERLGVMDPDHTPCTRAEVSEDVQRLQQALRQLNPDHEAVIRLRNWERLSFAEIGQRLGRSEEAAKKLWARAITRLKEVLPDQE